MILHVISVSGGKDSTAIALIAIARFGREKCRFVFADTGNEHQLVYEYLDYLESALLISVVRLKSDFSQEIMQKRMYIANDQRVGRKNGRKLRWSNKAKRRALGALKPTGIPYLDLCLWKGRFPSRMAQFCTNELKVSLLVEYQLALVDAGHIVVSWQGVRRDESRNRRSAKSFEKTNPSLYAYRPIVDWTAQQVVDFVRAQGLTLNPLYSMGFTRVGCMPCINANKNEFREIAARCPDHIEKIAAWEALVANASKRGAATFIKAPGISVHEAKDHCIASVVAWAKTTRGGKQYDLLATESATCTSAYGLCE